MLRSKLFPVMTDPQCSPLDAAFGARDGHYGGTFVLPAVDRLTVVFIREVVAVWLPITAQGLADAAACGGSASRCTWFYSRRPRPWRRPTSFNAGEAVFTVIGYQTLCGCFGTCQRIPQRLDAVRPTKLCRLLQVTESELRQTSARVKSSRLPSVLDDSQAS